MRKKLNMRKIIIASLALVFVLVTIVTSVFAAYRFTKTVEDEDVIIGKISNVSKSFLSYKKSSITQIQYSDAYYNELKLRQNTAFMLEDIKMTSTPTYGNAGNITEFTSGTQYYTKSGNDYVLVDTSVTLTPQTGVTYYVVTSVAYSISSIL